MFAQLESCIRVYLMIDCHDLNWIISESLKRCTIAASILNKLTMLTSFSPEEIYISLDESS